MTALTKSDLDHEVRTFECSNPDCDHTSHQELWMPCMFRYKLGSGIVELLKDDDDSEQVIMRIKVAD